MLLNGESELGFRRGPSTITARLFCCENQGGEAWWRGLTGGQNNDRISDKQRNGLDMDEQPLRGHWFTVDVAPPSNAW